MNRQDALDYLNSEYAEYQVESALPQAAILLAYNRAIDSALRMLNFVEGDLPTAVVIDAEVSTYFILLDYFALLRYQRVFALRPNVTVVGGVTVAQSQVFNQVTIMLNEAVDILEGMGYSPLNAVVSGRFNMDFLEPAPEDF